MPQHTPIPTPTFQLRLPDVAMPINETRGYDLIRAINNFRILVRGKPLTDFSNDAVNDEEICIAENMYVILLIMEKESFALEENGGVGHV